MRRAGPAFDLRDGGGRVLVGNRDGCLQAWFWGCPFGDLPVVDAAAQGCAEIQIWHSPRMRPDHRQDAEFDTVRIEMVAAHELQIAARAAAARRPCIAPRSVGLAFRILRPFGVALPAVASEQVDMRMPALFQIGVKETEIAWAMVNVAVGDRQTACALGLIDGVR